MKIIFKIIFLILITFAYAEAQPVTWMRYYNPSLSMDEGIDVIENYDSSYVFLSNTSNGICIIKTNKFGNIIWQKFLGDSLGSSSTTMQQTKDSGYVIAGASDGPGMQLIKTDNGGNIQWVRRYHRPLVSSMAWSVKLTNDNGFIIGGDNSNFSSYVVKTDSVGNMQWDNVYNGSAIYDIIQTKDGNYFSIGGSILRKIDSSGNEVWAQTAESTEKILQDKEGYLYIGGGLEHFYLAKYESSGLRIFSRSYFDHASCYGMCFAKNEDIILSGGIGTDTSNGDVIYSKLNQNGEIVYTKTVNIQGMSNEMVQSVRLTADNGLVMCGHTDYPTGGDFDDNILAVKTDSSGNTSSIVSVKNISTNINDFELFQNYPNPFNPVTKIKFTIPRDARRETRDVKLIIYDALGKEVETLINEKLSPGSYEAEFNGSNLPSGIYFYKLETGEFSQVKKMLLVK